MDVQLVFLDLVRDPKTERVTVVPTKEYNKKKQTLFALDCRFVEDVLAFFGRGVAMEMSEKKEKINTVDGKKTETRGGKFTLRPISREWQRDIWDSPVGQFVTKHNIRFFAIDSVTNPMQEFGTERENFPARANATNLLMLRAQLLTERLDLIGINIMHQSVDPANPWTRPQVLGGKPILYNHKYLLYIQHEKDFRTPSIKDLGIEKTKTTRMIWLMRHPSRQPWVRPIFFNLTSSGFVPLEVGGEITENVPDIAEEIDS
jgi:hypothetical protein